MSNIKIERFSFREFTKGMELGPVTEVKTFLPASRKKEVAPPPPPPPVYTEEDLTAAERDGYKKGFIEGEKEGRAAAENAQADIDRKVLAMQEKFTASITPLLNDYRKRALQFQKDMPQVAFAVAKKVAGIALAESAHAVIADIVERCCETMISEPKITITIHESMGDTLENKFQQIAARMPAATDIIILRDPTIAPHDCRIDWQNGNMERSTEQLWQQLEKVIENLAITNVRDTAESMQPLGMEPSVPADTTIIKKEE